ncbi:heavy metal-associated isoprenylated plant protein 35-like [Telopea speciosissima]|uniref:heavy metal-associated isoprenylated plant protein 35-like n=1 Tax=Telopea speciosissima TaxID=54955 RepID=UPI001CC41EDB|nr:heavy metal-associated isoprenylated plant protein 35-like [Telopea speciosissima]
MVPELEKPRITEIQVRMDCNGCVQKIKKALHGINGIYDVYIDFPQQKLTVVGWADPEKIVKAIKKTRKIATICAHRETSTETPAQPSEPAPPEGGGQPAPDAAKSPPAESPPTETAPPAEPPKDPPPPENPAPDQTTPSPVAADTAVPQQVHNHGLKDIENIHVIHHLPPDYGYGYSNGGHWNNYPTGHDFRPEPPVYLTHSYNTYKPFPSISETHSYNTYKPSSSISENEYFQSPQHTTHYSRTEHYSEDYHTRSNSGGNNITSMFSDENPNACRIV